MTRGSREADELVREAKGMDLKAVRNGFKWDVTNPRTGATMQIPTSGVGHSLSAIRRDMRELAETPSPMVAATSGPAQPSEQELTVRSLGDWDIGSLLIAAGHQEISVRVRNGLLEVSGPGESEPLARLLRDRAGEVLAHLNPPIPPIEEPDVAEIREIANIVRTSPQPVRNVVSDAQGLWQIVRDLAKTQGDVHTVNAGIEGVMWRGALSQVMAQTCPDWDDDYRKEIASHLERTGHTHCQSRYAKDSNGKASPIWWIREEWDDGGLTVTRKVPSPKALAKAKPEPVQSANGSGSATGGALAFLQQMDARIAAAEQRADAAEAVIVELEAERDAAIERAERVETELATINALFARIGGGAG